MSEQSFPVRRLRLADVVVDMRIQVRKPGENAAHIDKLAEAYKAWAEAGGPCPIPPPVVYECDGRYVLAEGFSRTSGAEKAGLTELEYEVRPGAWEDAHHFGGRANLRNNSLPLSAEAVREAFVRELTYVPDMTHGYYAGLFSVTPQTIGRWIKEVAPELAARKERRRGDGTVVQVRGGGRKPKGADKPAASNQDDKTKTAGGGGKSDAAATSTTPETEIAPERKRGEYPPDERFMPHAADAKTVAAAMLAAKRSLEAVRAELRKLFADPKHVVAARLHYHSTFDGNLTAMIEDLGVNAPTHVCPDCAGTGEADGVPCRTCDGYGLMSATQQSPLAGRWKKTGGKYDALCKRADLAEAMG